MVQKPKRVESECLWGAEPGSEAEKGCLFSSEPFHTVWSLKLWTCVSLLEIKFVF